MRRGWKGPPSNARRKRPVEAPRPRQTSLQRWAPQGTLITPTLNQESAAVTLVGNGDAWRNFNAWLQQAKGSPRPQVCVLVGPCGVGKTFGVHLHVTASGSPLVELIGGDVVSAPELAKDLVEASTRAGLEGARPIILLDDVDSIQPDSAPAAVAFAQDRHPNAGVVIYTCCGSAIPYHLRSLKALCKVFYINKLTPEDINAILCLEFTKDIVRLTMQKLKSENMIGDARQAVCTARLLSCDTSKAAGSSRKDDTLSLDPFSTARKLLYCKNDIEQAGRLICLNPFPLVQNLLFDNYMSAMAYGSFLDIEKLASRADLLSLADTIRWGNTNPMLAESHLLWAKCSAGNSQKDKDPRHTLKYTAIARPKKIHIDETNIWSVYNDGWITEKTQPQ